ncbi:hypothetical protein A3A45_02900, partial [Candidatus Daviesbacteria bacterium RIFCSPLOWO2_01_FULL_36_8]
LAAKPLDEVFAFTSDPNNLPLWSGASAVEMVSEMADQVGSVYKVTFSSFFKKYSILIEITEYNSPNSWEFKTEEKPASVSKYTFEEVEGETKITLNLTEDQESESLISDISIKRKLDNLLINLKKYLEK